MNNLPPNLWAVIAVVGTLVLYVAFLRPGKKTKDPLAKPPFQTTLSQQRQVERQMESLLVELSEMARQITAQLDTRASKLDLLIQEADAKIQQLKSLLPQAAGPSSEATRSTPTQNGPPTPAPASAAAPPSSAPTVDPRHAAIYRLADTGLSLQQIAQELKQPRGEVELILNLRNQR